MSTRDELADLITEFMESDVPESVPDKHEPLGIDYAVADAILAAGWRPPARIVTTVEELDALAVGTVVMEGDHGTPDDTGWGFKTMPGVFHRFPDGWHVVAGHGERAPDLPATVLWEPEEAE